MKTLFFPAAIAASLTAVHAQEATQVIDLVSGWNAIWLEVEPHYPPGHPRAFFPKSPEDAFDTATNTSVTAIASPKELAGLAEVFGDAPTSPTGAVGTFNQDTWEIWRSTPVTPNSLVATTGHRGYLIKTDGASQITVSGKARFHRPTWVPDRYNLIGFGAPTGAAPTFNSFFDPSGGSHPVSGARNIFTLESGGNWVPVSGGSQMTPGAAYWIFSDGPSDYMGPVSVDFDLAITGKLNFGDAADAVPVLPLNLDLEEIVFTNRSTAPASPRLELTSGGTDLALHVTTPDPAALTYNLGNQVDSTPADGTASDLEKTVAPVSTGTLTLGADATRWDSGAVSRTHVYRLEPGGGAAFWLPVSATRTNLAQPTDTLPDDPAGLLTGLWVGEVDIDSVTSIVIDGSPSQSSAGAAPVRILLHSDADGAVRLLSQVTVMQRKSADLDTIPEPVLITDRQKIPFFEGIKERGGKRVGLRIQTVAYDMPRLLDPAGEALLASAGTNRPPALQENYHLTWPLEGALGAGKTVRTPAASPLTLDPFHRSNPFRHAFHQQHTRGADISREISLVFGLEQSSPDRLTGTFTETLTGVTKTPIALSGAVTLQRVSAVATLDPAN